MADGLNRLEIRLTWTESDHPDSIERACAAELSIHVSDFCLTQLEDRHVQTVRPILRASAYRLALWFAQNWWRLRWEPEQSDMDWQMAHSLAAAGGGYTWPALSFIGDGEGTLLRMRPSTAVPTENIRYLVHADIPIQVDQYTEAIDCFIEAVIARLYVCGHPNTDLEQLWNEVRAERNTAAVMQWRKLEALASLDPDADEAGFLKQLLDRQQQTGLGAIEELVATSKNRAQAALTSLLNGCRSAATPLHCDDIDRLRRYLTDDVGMNKSIRGLGNAKPPPWQLGYDVAAIARQYWNLNPGKVTNAILDQLFGVPEKVVMQVASMSDFPISAGYRNPANQGLAVWLNMRPPTGRRFALARLVGDHLCSGEQERLLPATAAKTARQKFQRAFAQQFLCPINDLREFLNTDHPDDEQIEDAASEFDVSPLLIKTTLVNHGLLGRQVLQ
ncbi:MAG: hypothetical protein ACOYMW_14725 [Candidatus Competibacteraceae bacterium]